MSRPEPTPPAFELAPRELGRYLWRQLTSMRTALVLLLLLALAAIPGSVVPQEPVDSSRVARWQDQHPQLTPIYDRLGLFDVYASPWFAAVYLLLMISLVGCIVPRCLLHWRDWRADPPRTPARLSRLPEHRRFTTDEPVGEVLEHARTVFRDRGYRVVQHPDSVAAEKGRLRELGNLVFHLAVLVVLAGFGLGSLLGFRGSVVVVTGEGFSNTVTQYDNLDPGGLFTPADLAPFSFTVKDFSVHFVARGRSAGAARDFHADLAVRPSPTARPRVERIAVNHPLDIDGTDVFLVGHGYAPHITVRDGRGQVAYSGPTVFLPEGADFRSFGVVKAPDAVPAQIGLEGEFYPTYGFTDATGPFSAFPDARNPAISMLAYRGDLGLDDGEPQSVYALERRGIAPIMRSDGRPMRVDLSLGTSVRLPHHLGSVSFDGLSRFVRLQVSRTPGTWLALVGTLAGLLGLLASLFVRPRRAWVRAWDERGRTVGEVAGLDRGSGADLDEEVDRLLAALTQDNRERT